MRNVFWAAIRETVGQSSMSYFHFQLRVFHCLASTSFPLSVLFSSSLFPLMFLSIPTKGVPQLHCTEVLLLLLLLEVKHTFYRWLPYR